MSAGWQRSRASSCRAASLRACAADRGPGEAAVGGRGSGDGLGGEHLVVGGEAGDAGAGLVPHDPRHLVVGAGERDVGLDAVALQVDVQRRIAVADEAAALRRFTPVCCQQNVTLGACRARCRAVGRPWPRARRRSDPCRLVAPPSFSFHATHGTGSLPGRHGGAAGHRGVLRVAVGVDVQRRELLAALRSWPSGIQTLSRWSRSGWRRCSLRRRGRRWARTSSPTARCVPRRRSRSTAPRPSGWWSMFSDAGKPWVFHAPFLNARTKICWLGWPVFCSNVAQGTFTPPAASEPPTTSETPAGCRETMPAAGRR